MIVVEDERLRVPGIDMAADASISGAQITIRREGRHLGPGLFQRLSAPRTILTMRGDNHPFFA
jgi:hypothetical protein